MRRATFLKSMAFALAATALPEISFPEVAEKEPFGSFAGARFYGAQGVFIGDHITDEDRNVWLVTNVDDNSGAMTVMRHDGRYDYSDS
jgi:hypothetical protein